jgi:predicted ATPase
VVRQTGCDRRRFSRTETQAVACGCRRRWAKFAMLTWGCRESPLRSWLMLSLIAVHGYRSLRDVVLPLDQLTVVTGANGSGKSSVYRALRLLADCGRGELIGSLAREGGLQSARWAGPVANKRPVELKLGYAADDLGYVVDFGLTRAGQLDVRPRSPDKARSGFRWCNVTTRLDFGTAVWPLAEVRAEAGDHFDELTRALPAHRSLLSEFAGPGELSELVAVRNRLRSWRFYDGFRVDADAPARRPQVGTRTPMLADDGADLAATIQTIIEAGAGSGAEELERAIHDAFDGAHVSVVSNDGLFDLQIHQPGMLRPLRSAELSDGTLRFLLWAAALLGPEHPSLMVLNEPETSLHRSCFSRWRL